jgi:hypothetical protein
MSLHYILSGVSRRISRKLNALALRRVLRTPPLKMRRDGPVFLSMLCHRDLHMYLTSFKSIYRHVGFGRAVIVDDGSLTGDDRALLQRHIPELAFIDIASIDRGPCPAGGTWERLLKVVDLSADDYVIQLDADCVTAGPIDEVVEAYRANRAFTLAGEATTVLTTALTASRRDTHRHVQAAAEIALGDLPDAATVKYVRGCSGFTGFPRGGVVREDLYKFSDFMSAKLGERWTEWGTEQFSSNFLLANCPDVLILPWDKYCSYWAEPTQGVAFYHFIGTYRYHGGVYTRVAKQAIQELM